MRRNRKLYIGIIGAICIIFFLFDPLGHRVQISSDFVEWQYGMPDYAGLKRVEIDGILRTPFLGKKNFVGTINIEGVTESWDSTKIHAPFLDTPMGKNAQVFLRFDNSGYNEAVKGCHLFCNNDMSIISIILPSFDDGPVVTSLTSSRILTYPAKSREEAVTHTLTLYTEAGTPFNGQ